MAKDHAVIGAAGEHLVLSRLLSRGILAAKAPDGTSVVDLVVHQSGLNGELRIPVAIQVKTRLRGGGDGGWHMQKKHEYHVEPWLFYAFVDFVPESPIVYIIPSSKVAQVVRDQHATWLALPGARGQAHNDSKMRRIRPKWPYEVPGVFDGWLETYKEAWHLLGVLPATNMSDAEVIEDVG